MKKIIILERIVKSLQKGTISYARLHEIHVRSEGIHKSEFDACIKELKINQFIDYHGNFSADEPGDVVLTRHGEDMLVKYRSYEVYLKSHGTTRYDRFVRWAKNNLIIILITIVTIAVGSVAGILNGSRSILDVFGVNTKAKVLFRCTPSGPDVNIRKAPGGNSDVLFQLSHGTYFDVLELGPPDRMHNKNGQWYRIDYKGEKGYIFSAYTYCD